MRYSTLLFLIMLSVLIVSCAGSVKNLAPVQKVPINVENHKLPPIGVKQITSALTPGQEIGAHYDGIAKIRQQTYYAQGSISEDWQYRYKEIVIDELTNAGYKTQRKSNLFESDDSFNARFLIGGILRSSTIQSFGPLAGNYTEELVSVEWQLYDREQREVIYKLQTQGYGEVNGVNTEALALALRNCFRNFLADNGLVECLIKYESSGSITSEITSINYHTETINFDSTKSTIEAASDAIFAIKTEDGHGSGFIINEEGYALTNYHVIEGRSQFDAIFMDGKIIRVNVVDVRQEQDLALLKLSGRNYPYLVIGKKESINLGEEVYAIGTPVLLGLSHSVSKGIISGIRNVDRYTLLQTDASINPGNSGGPLIDNEGRAIGVVSLKLVGEKLEGLGFAI